jgi:5-methylcytosine-specific restriction endonuclease McrA
VTDWRSELDRVRLDADAWWTTYGAYLSSEEWAERRRLVLERAGLICQGCRRARATQVHHLTYVHVGEEFLWELAAICNDCHERLHPHMAAEGHWASAEGGF